MKFTVKWMELERNYPNEVPQAQKDKYGRYSLICGC